MYLKKIEGLRTVTLPDGSVLSQADLPPSETNRWVASRKAAVVNGVRYGLITRESAKDRYRLSDEELDEWLNAVKSHGTDALKTTSIQKYRQP